MTAWLEETLYPGWGQRFQVLDVLVRLRSPFQEIAVIQTASHGKVLVLDGNVQITEADEFVYQEMIAHVPLIVHEAARRVLIIGAGDGGVLRRVLEHRDVETAVMVEIDGDVIQIAKRFMPGIAGDAWYDPRATVIVGDGVGYVAEAAESSFDVIIVDSTDPVGVGEALFTEAFYKNCARILGPTGIVVNQCGVPFMQSDELRETSLRRAKFFPLVTAYVAAVPTYVGGFMALGLAAKTPGVERVSSDVIRSRSERAGIMGKTRYWSPEVQAAAFHLPPYIRQCLPD